MPLTRALADSCSLPLRIMFVSLSLKGTGDVSELYCQDLMIECIVMPYLISNKRALLVFPMLDRKLGAISGAKSTDRKEEHKMRNRSGLPPGASEVDGSEECETCHRPERSQRNSAREQPISDVHSRNARYRDRCPLGRKGHLIRVDYGIDRGYHRAG